MPHLFFNGPVQNGDFTFAAKPGKAVGIRIAGALNRILGAPVAPHLWNTVTLAGDLRYLQHIEAARAPIAREDFEAAIIAAKYGDGSQPPAGTATDTDKSVADLAMTMITERLSLGVLRLTDETIFECARCGHMIGTRHHHCRACGHDISHTRIARHLTSDRKPGENVLDFTRIHARKRRPPFHLQNIAANTPTRLILSRTRSHGIDLSPVGLPSQLTASILPSMRNCASSTHCTATCPTSMCRTCMTRARHMVLALTPWVYLRTGSCHCSR